MSRKSIPSRIVGSPSAVAHEVGRGGRLDAAMVPELDLDRDRAGRRGVLDDDPGVQVGRDRRPAVPPGAGEFDLLGGHAGQGMAADEPVIAPPAVPLADLLGLPDPAGLEPLDVGTTVALGVEDPPEVELVGEDLQLRPSGVDRERRQRDAADLGPRAVEREDGPSLGHIIGRRRMVERVEREDRLLVIRVARFPGADRPRRLVLAESLAVPRQVGHGGGDGLVAPRERPVLLEPGDAVEPFELLAGEVGHAQRHRPRAGLVGVLGAVGVGVDAHARCSRHR